MVCFFFNDTATTEIYTYGHTLSLHDALPISLQGVKDARRKESEAAAKALGAHDIEFFDLGDYPLAVGAEAKDRLVSVMRKVQPAFMLTHSKADPYNSDHPYATQVTLECRSTAQAWGHNPGEKALGAPQLYLFEPHQTEQCEWRPDKIGR